jgi:hypothetical protein
MKKQNSKAGVVVFMLADVPHSVWEALCSRLDDGPASVRQLANVAQQAGLRLGTTYLLEQWLEKQRAAAFIELVNEKWQVRSPPASRRRQL